MKVLVVGAGALGSLLAARMSHHHDVTVAVRKGGAKPLNGQVVVEGDRRTPASVSVRVAEGMPNEPFDAAFLAVKSYDAAEAIDSAASRLDCPVGLPQNGLLHLDMALETLGPRAVFMSVTYGASSVSPGRALFGGEGKIELAALERSSEHLATVEEVLKTSGFDTGREDDARLMVWRKTGVNCCINPLTAILRCANGRLLESPDAVEVMRSAAGECEAVAERYGLELGNVFERSEEVCRRTAANRSSMLQDVEDGRRTEIDSICLAVAALGAASSTPTPVNLALGRLVKSMKRTIHMPGER